MTAHPLVSKPHAKKLRSIWTELELPNEDDDGFITTKSWKQLLVDASDKDLGEFGFCLLMTVGLSTSGGINLRGDKEKDRQNHDLIRFTSSEVLSLKKAEFTAGQLTAVLKHIEILPSHLMQGQLSYGWLVVGGLKPHFVKNRPVTPELKQMMRHLRKNMSHVDGGYEKYVALIDKLLGEDPIQGPVLWRSDAWMTAYCDLAEDFDEEKNKQWQEVLRLAFAAKGSKPAKKYLKSIAAAIGILGEHEFIRVMKVLLASIGHEGPMVQYGFMGFMDQDRSRLDKEYTNLLRALVWPTTEMPELTAVLGAAANACFEPMPNTGGRCTKVGAACVKSLSSIGSKEALGLIHQIRDQAESKSVIKAINRALE